MPFICKPPSEKLPRSVTMEQWEELREQKMNRGLRFIALGVFCLALSVLLFSTHQEWSW